MELIQNYINEVTEKLPEDIRKSVSEELERKIQTMLPDNATESDIREVIKKLKNTTKSTNVNVKRYLIGPNIYDSYISVLKLVVSIVVVVFACISLVTAALDNSIHGSLVNIVIELIVDVFSGVGQGIIQAILWVTVAFVIMDRNGVRSEELSYSNKRWSFNNLNSSSAGSGRRIPRGETAVEMFFVVIFALIICKYPNIIGIYEGGKVGLTLVLPLFTEGGLHPYLTAIILLSVGTLGVLVWKFICGNWNIPIAIASTIINTCACVLVIVMISDKSLFNGNFISGIGKVLEIPTSDIKEGFKVVIRVFIAIFIAANLWDSIAGFLKCKK